MDTSPTRPDQHELVLMENVIKRAEKLVDYPINIELRRKLEWSLLELNTHRRQSLAKANSAGGTQ